MNRKTFGSVVRKARKARGMSLRSFAAALQLSPAFVSHVERGMSSMPTAERIRAMAQVLATPADDLFAAAGLVPDDVARIVADRRESWALIRATWRLKAAEVERLTLQAHRYGGAEL